MKGAHFTNLTLFNTAIPSCSPVRLSQFNVIVGAPKNVICSPAPEIPSEFIAFHRLSSTSVCRLKMWRTTLSAAQETMEVVTPANISLLSTSLGLFTHFI